jgi:cation transport regulator ChaC
MKFNKNNICIFAYGSLISNLGEDLKNHVVDKIDKESPFKVEYVRKSSSRGYAPTLTRYEDGSKVNGMIIVLDLKNEPIKVKEWLRKREEAQNIKYIKTASYSGFETVLYCEFPQNIESPSPDELAELAIKSVVTHPKRNGIKYLYNNMNNKIITPLTNAYKKAILQKTDSKTLKEAESKIKQQI